MKLSVIATKYSWLTKNKEPQAKNIGNPGGRGILCLGNPDGREGGGQKMLPSMGERVDFFWNNPFYLRKKTNYA